MFLSRQTKRTERTKRKEAFAPAGAMTAEMKTNTLYYTVLILAGIVLGSLAANLCANVSFLKWLSFGLSFGTEAPVTLDLSVLRLTFGITVNLSVSVILFVTASLIIGRKLMK